METKKFYKQSPYGEFDVREMLLIFDSLHGESREYIELLVTSVQKEWASYQGHKPAQIGDIQARELIAGAMAKGYWIPSSMRSKT